MKISSIKKITRCILCIAFVLSITFSYKLTAKPIKINQLHNYATTAFQQRGGMTGEENSLKEMSYKIDGSDTLMVICTFSNEGFIIMSCDDAVMPVLAYSVSNSIDMGNYAPAVGDWLDAYAKEIKQIRTDKRGASDEVAAMWAAITGNTKALTTTVTVPALLHSIWNQTKYYNQYSPEDDNSPGGYDGKVPNGCVAVAMAQIMYYYRYPSYGQGSHTNQTDYGNFTVNFGNQHYCYEAMLDKLTSTNNEVAKLIFHCATSVDMMYAPEGSGAYSSNVPAALQNYFKYSSTASYTSRSNHSNNEWQTLIKNELNNGCPVYYSGNNNEGGHAFVCDGYDSDNLYHFNFGWGGSGDGFYTLAADDEDAAGGFYRWQGMVYSIYPTSNYPLYCPSTPVITAVSGTLEDGSGNTDYLNNTDCYYILAVDDALSYKISLTGIDTETDVDTLTFWDGNPANGHVIATFSGHNNSTQMFVATTDSVYITFKTNDSITGTGWRLKYTATRDLTKCSITLHRDLSGSFDDGSGDKSYCANAECAWFISNPGSSYIDISFSEFDVSPEDGVYLYDGDVLPNELLASFTGSTIPDTYRCYTQQVRVAFRSDNYLQKDGFVCNWVSNLYTGIRGNESQQFFLYPNPASSYVTIEFTATHNENYQLVITDLTGKIVYQDQLTVNGNLIKINTDFLADGFYTLSLRNDQSILSKKLIIH